MNRGWAPLWRDLAMAREQADFWPYLALKTIRLTYARSLFGPFWITLTLGLQVGALSVLLSALLGTPSFHIAPWISLGLILWTFIASSLTEASTLIRSHSPYFFDRETSVSGFVAALLLRQMVITAHHALVWVLLAPLFAIWPGWSWLLALATLPVLVVTLFGLCLCLAVITPRFRDLERLTDLVLMAGFFLTPVLWRQRDLLNHHFIATWNPLTHLLAIVRDPLLGGPVPLFSLAVSIVSALLALLLGAVALVRCRPYLTGWI